MKLFTKKKKKIEDELDEEEELDDEEQPVKKIRRLKQKEKPKEWGKRERLIVLGVLVLTMLASGIFALIARNWKLPGLPRIQAPQIPSLSIFEGETIYLEPNKKNVTKRETIKTEFSNLTKSLSGVYGLYVINLDDGFSLGVNHEEKFEPASLNKLPLIVTAYRLEDAGVINLDDEYVLKNSDKIGGSGSLSGKPEGTVVSYRDMIILMGKESDNTSYGVLRKRLGDEVVRESIKELGMSTTSIPDNYMTPRDIGTLMYRVYDSKYISDTSKDELLNSLTDTIYESWITKGVPDDIVVAHKFGREVNVTNDAGVVFAINPYVIVIMSKGTFQKEADSVIPLISEMVYRVLNEN